MTDRNKRDEENPDADLESTQGESHGTDNALGQREPGSPYLQREGVTYPQSEHLQRSRQAEGAAATTTERGEDQERGQTDRLVEDDEEEESG